MIINVISTDPSLLKRGGEGKSLVKKGKREDLCKRRAIESIPFPHERERERMGGFECDFM